MDFLFPQGVSDPRVTLDKREAIEGGVVMVNCSVPEEKPPIHFTVEKLKLHANGFKQKREKKKSSYNQNFVMLEFSVEEQDHVIYFQCQATIFSENRMEYSRAIKSELVTVTGQSPTLLSKNRSFWFAGWGWRERAPNSERGAGIFWLGCFSQDHS